MLIVANGKVWRGMVLSLELCRGQIAMVMDLMERAGR